MIYDEKGTLRLGEVHPSSYTAMEYVKKRIMHPSFFVIKEAMASTALSGNRYCEICLTTLERIENGEPVSDRYLLGLAWFLYEIKEL